MGSTFRRCFQIHSQAGSEGAQNGGQGYRVAKADHGGLRGCPVFLGNATGPGWPVSGWSLDEKQANAIVVGLRSAKSRFLENAAADRPGIWWLCFLCGTAPLRRSPGRGEMACHHRISRAAVLGISKRAWHWLLCFTKGNQPLFIPPSLYP